MLSLIKSKYILAEIFDFLKVKQRLKLIVHNKNMQEKLDINNETYRQNCGKYTELNGDQGKEYLNEDNMTEKDLLEVRLNLLTETQRDRQLLKGRKRSQIKA